MKNLGHTPGTWTVATNGGRPEDEPAFPNVYIKTESGDDICAVTFGTSEECKEHARLIAAAPGMLEALVSLLRVTDPYRTGGMQHQREAISISVAIIEKATGMKIEEVLS